VVSKVLHLAEECQAVQHKRSSQSPPAGPGGVCTSGPRRSAHLRPRAEHSHAGRRAEQTTSGRRAHEERTKEGTVQSTHLREHNLSTILSALSSAESPISRAG